MKIITLPGLIDSHVHLRDPGQTEKEDFYTGTTAALAGGFTTVLDMPNNKIPITTYDRLRKKIKNAEKKTVCDIGFYFGSLGDNFDEFKKVFDLVFGLKLYLNLTTGHYLINEEKLNKIYDNWLSDLPILVHSEEDTIDLVLNVIKKTHKKTHFCHISSELELKQIIQAKEEELPVTCGVTPHHLFLTEDDGKLLGSFAMMKPPLKTRKDQEFLWKNINYIDIVESDHAPHTKEEKKSDKQVFGVPGLETTLPLLLKAESDNRLTIDQIVELCFINPAKIFKIPTDKNTNIEVDLKKYTFDKKCLKTKCGWTPFDGYEVRGEVQRVFIRGQKVYEDGQVLVNPGFGKVLHSSY